MSFVHAHKHTVGQAQRRRIRISGTAYCVRTAFRLMDCTNAGGGTKLNEDEVRDIVEPRCRLTCCQWNGDKRHYRAAIHGAGMHAVSLLVRRPAGGHTSAPIECCLFLNIFYFVAV